MMRHYPPRKPATGNTSWNGTRDRATQARFRRMLIQRDGPVCRRCHVFGVELQAHHTSEHDGMMLCRPCHRQVDANAR